MTSRELIFGIRDWFAWKPQLETRADWRARASAVASGLVADGENNPISLPMMLRRRVSAFGQKVIGAALAAQPAGQPRYIFATRHGEFATTLRILEEIHQRTAPSPADFSMSVHNSLAGLMSIHTGNKAGHTTISAGTESFAYGVMEAAATALEQQPSAALLVSYDEPLPEAYRNFKEREEAQLPLIVVLDIVEPKVANHRFSLSMRPNATCSISEFAKDQDVPMGQQFIDFFLSAHPQTEIIGETMTWIWRRVN